MESCKASGYGHGSNGVYCAEASLRSVQLDHSYTPLNEYNFKFEVELYKHGSPKLEPINDNWGNANDSNNDIWIYRKPLAHPRYSSSTSASYGSSVDSSYGTPMSSGFYNGNKSSGTYYSLDDEFDEDKLEFSTDACRFNPAMKSHTRPHRGRPSKSAEEKFVAICFHGIKGVRRDHWEVILEDEKLSFVCNLCAKVFNNSYALKQHIRFVHMLIRPFACSSCPKKFRSMYDLRRHNTTHTNERFACLNCGSDFSSRQRAHLHVRKSCVGYAFASTLSELYQTAKEQFGDQWERIQAENSFRFSSSDTCDYNFFACNAPVPKKETAATADFPAEPIPVEMPDLW